jgi:esterase/lipase superfamily enzyme
VKALTGFAAPDVSRDLFKELTVRVNKVAKRMTLYASSKDKALIASKALALNIPRLATFPLTVRSFCLGWIQLM